MKIHEMERKRNNAKRILTACAYVLLVMSLFTYTGCSSDSDEEPEVYTVTFDADGGSPVPAAQRVEAGNTASAPTTNPVKTGNVFVFWYLSGATTAYNFQTPVKNDFTLHAKWQEEATVEYWQVTWNLNGGAWPSDDNHAIQVVKGGTLAEPNVPVKSGYTFDGWYKEPDLTNKISFPYDVSSVTSHFTLYAKWTTESGGPVDPSGYTMFTSISSLRSWLSGQPDNTVETPYKVGLKDINLDTGNNWGDLGKAIGGLKTKYVDLYLQDCTATSIPDGYKERELSTVTYYGVFLQVNNLVAITLPKGIKTIGVYAFRKCENLKSVVVHEGLTAIHQEAFKNCFSLSAIDFPDGLESIGSYAFEYCSLTSFDPPKSLKRIEEFAFSGCTFTTLTIPTFLASAFLIEGESAAGVFEYCTMLQSVVIEEGLEVLPASIFSGCKALQTISLPQSLKKIEHNVFYQCKTLTSIVIPNKVTDIGGNAFSYSGLSTITLSDELRTIGQAAFSYTSINSITFPAKMESIGDYAFNYTGIAEVILLGETPPTLKSLAGTYCNTFYPTNSSFTIKVPANSVDVYKTTGRWVDYAKRIVAND